jgi:hypothetical protein
MVSRSDILDTAKEYVTKDRAATHGDAEDNFRRIAALWNAYLEPEASISSEDVAVMMTLLKVARIASNEGNVDNWIDGAGYLACGGEIATERARAASVAFRLARQVDAEDEQMGFYEASQRL